MPLTKKVIARFRIINNCLTDRRKRYWTIEELIEKLVECDIAVSRRTVEGDLRLMRYDEQLAYFAPIEYNRRLKGHYYADQDYSIEGVPLTDEDIRNFSNLVGSFRQYRGAQPASEIEPAFARLKKMVEQLKRKRSRSPWPVDRT